jgi:hypothetical protein
MNPARIRGELEVKSAGGEAGRAGGGDRPGAGLVGEGRRPAMQPGEIAHEAQDPVFTDVQMDEDANGGADSKTGGRSALQ